MNLFQHASPHGPHGSQLSSWSCRPNLGSVSSNREPLRRFKTKQPPSLYLPIPLLPPTYDHIPPGFRLPRHLRYPHTHSLAAVPIMTKSIVPIVALATAAFITTVAAAARGAISSSSATLHHISFTQPVGDGPPKLLARTKLSHGPSPVHPPPP